MEVVVTTGLLELYVMQSSSQIITTNKPTSGFFTGWMPILSPNQQCQSTEGKYHIPWTGLPQAHLGVFQLCLWLLTAPGCLGGGLPCLSSALWCQYTIWCRAAKFGMVTDILEVMFSRGWLPLPPRCVWHECSAVVKQSSVVFCCTAGFWHPFLSRCQTVYNLYSLLLLSLLFLLQSEITCVRLCRH